MTYDDDTGSSVRHVIKSDEPHRQGDAAALSKAQRDAIVKLAKKYPAWEPYRICDELKRTGMTVPVNAVAAVLASEGSRRGR
ncbi:hypothetical protein [Nonomuraea aridisoli]|nr:hypothetical protein [Nonomuraea aridisoli]